MQPDEAAEVLGRALREDRLCVLVGSRASAASEEPNGRTHDGLPTPAEFVDLCAGQFGYVSPSDGFNAACDKIVDRDKRAKLEELLLRYYLVPGDFEAPPAHRMLAWLPVSIFLTSNYDQFIERSLETEGRPPHILVDNTDIVRLKRWHVPVVKYHGCVTRPGSLVAATPDYETLEKDRHLVRSFIASSVAGKTLLVVGHGLGDPDLSRILADITEALGGYAPTIFVLRPADGPDRIPGLAFPVEVVQEELTQFLSRLLQQVRHLDHGQANVFNEEWMSSAFFAALRQASVLPSETQVIDAFLAHLQDELGAREGVEDILADADAAVHLALDVRPNYEALTKIWKDVTETLAGIADAAEAESTLREFREERGLKVAKFKSLGASLIKRNERLLIFSQSQRVIQTLLGVPTAVQRTAHIFVAECRPKSPMPYQDAAATCQQLADTYYSVTVCPDVVAGYLLTSHQIDRVVMGTHAIFNDPATGVAHSFVNTCGARLLAETALRYEVPVEVLGESLKEEPVSALKALDHVHIHQESDLLESAIGLRDIRTRRSDIVHLNVGYDLVRVEPGMTIHIADR